jgi:hypothetical protein
MLRHLPASAGATSLAAALLSALEGLPVHGVGLPALLSDPGEMRDVLYMRSCVCVWARCTCLCTHVLCSYTRSCVCVWVNCTCLCTDVQGG